MFFHKILFFCDFCDFFQCFGLVLGGETCFVFFRKTLFRSKDGVQTASLRRKMSKKACPERPKSSGLPFFRFFCFLLPFKIPLVYMTEKLVFSRFLCSQRYTVPERSVMNVFFCKLRLILLTQLGPGCLKLSETTRPSMGSSRRRTSWRRHPSPVPWLLTVSPICACTALVKSLRVGTCIYELYPLVD